MGQNRQGDRQVKGIQKSRKVDRMGQTGRKEAERWTGGGRQAKGRRISIKIDSMGQNRQSDRQAKGT